MSNAAPTNQEAQIELHKKLAPRYAYRYGFEYSRLFQQDWHAEMISHVHQVRSASWTWAAGRASSSRSWSRSTRAPWASTSATRC